MRTPLLPLLHLYLCMHSLVVVDALTKVRCPKTSRASYRATRRKPAYLASCTLTLAPPPLLLHFLDSHGEPDDAPYYGLCAAHGSAFWPPIATTHRPTFDAALGAAK